MKHFSNRISLFSLISLVVVITVAIVAIQTVPRLSRTGYGDGDAIKRQVDARPRMGQQGIGACAHLKSHTRILESVAPNLSLADFVSGSMIIAKVRVVSISPPMFGTTSGDVPLPYPAGYEDPESDAPYNPQYDQSIHQLVVLDATQVYSGTMSPGVVVVDDASQHPACPNYVFTTDPDQLPVAVGDTGLAFLRTVTSTVFDPPMPGWASHALNLRDQLNNSDPNNQYEYVSLMQFYKYDGSSASTWWGQVLPVADLETDLESLLTE